MPDMGIFRTTIAIENPLKRGTFREIADVMVAEPGDMTPLGARAREGLNLRVDVVTKMLVPAGPVPAAVAA